MPWLASALQKIQSYAHQIPNEDAERVPAAAHLFIINPLTGQGMDNLFSTHPNTENRIAALERLAREWSIEGSVSAEPPLSPPQGESSGPWSGNSGPQRAPYYYPQYASAT